MSPAISHTDRGHPRKSRTPSAVHARPVKPKRVTYTGCWTCRSRKVKCDERSRNGCGVCERLDLECAGYGVNLCWNSDKGHKDASVPRRSIRLDRSSSLALPGGDIDRILSTLDLVSPNDTVAMGPFSVFRYPAWASGNAIWGGDWTGRDGKLVASSKPLQPRGARPDHNEDGLGKTETPRFEISAPSSAISLPLFRDPEISLLMFHYKDHVAGLLQPVAHPKNPWRTTYFPFALQGRPDLFLAQGSTPTSQASTAIFHGLLSSAAFHLRNINNGLERFHMLGLRHRAKSLQALNAALASPKDSQTYIVQLTAMLSLVTIDTITGEDSDFLIHLQGGQQLRRYHDIKSLTSSSRQVNSICHFLSLLARTTSSRALREPPETTWLPEMTLFDHEDRDIEYIYGITPTLGNLLYRTCQLSDLLENCSYPLVQIRRVQENLREDLLNWNLESEQFQRIDGDAVVLEIIHYQARAFYSAILILYYRAVEMHHSINPEQEAHTIWVQLKLAEERKRGNTRRKMYAAPMSWPAFIAACEARHREPWIEWWEMVQDYNLGNFRRQWTIIREVWARVDASGLSMCWRDALRQSGKLVLPV